MKKLMLLIMINLVLFLTVSAKEFEKDAIETSKGTLEITFIGHGTLMFTFDGKTIHVDPWSELADYTNLPKADIILITHEHRDHLDLKAVDILKKPDTEIILTETCAEQVNGGIIMKNYDVKEVKGIIVEAVPAYNLVHMRDNGKPFHPKGRGNGYVIIFGDKKLYVAGDTENVPEMKELNNIDIAFLPVNLPYTMTPEMAADAAKMFTPKILYPYHYGETKISKIVDLFEEEKDIDVRIRNMK